MDLNDIPEVLSSTGTIYAPKALGDGPFRKTPIFGSKKQSEDLQRFEWPSAKELQTMSLD